MISVIDKPEPWLARKHPAIGFARVGSGVPSRNFAAASKQLILNPPHTSTRPAASNTACIFVLFAVLAILLAPAPTPSQATRESGTIHVAVNRVEVGVTVTDARGHFVQGLERSNFQVLDNGEPQPITDFAA